NNVNNTNNVNNVTPVCGNGLIEEGEECEGTDFGGETCETNGFSGGSLSCTACAIDTATCGNSQVEIVCNRWNQDRADLSEGSWSGDTGTCLAGDISATGRANALKIVNLYRFLADLPPVTTDPVKDQKAQECALMMTANNQLNHSPPTGWDCYTDDGAQAAGSSNLATTPGVAAVDLYMVDPGNPTTMGHRRWILSNSFGPTGLGSTNSYSCMWAFGSSSAGKQWTAWPHEGIFPLAAGSSSWSSINSTGWTFQSDSINLTGVQVTITMDGSVDRPVSVTHLLANYGSSYAISMIPQGWVMEAGHTYEVAIDNVSTPVTYSVQVVGCN
ncbi:CAP domain-containing protein, partial [Myxococcota bacterium]|nr:CAP domain-containing protein [Myxococcota bacterium]